MEQETPRMDAPGSTDESYTSPEREKQVKSDDKPDQYQYRDWASI